MPYLKYYTFKNENMTEETVLCSKTKANNIPLTRTVVDITCAQHTAGKYINYKICPE